MKVELLVKQCYCILLALLHRTVQFTYLVIILSRCYLVCHVCNCCSILYIYVTVQIICVSDLYFHTGHFWPEHDYGLGQR